VIADTTPRAFLDSTGEEDPDNAFLALVEKDARAHPRSEHRAGDPGAEGRP
jgi:ABC-2 type transport system ATP-binding protein